MRFELSPLDLVIVLLAALHPRFDLWVEQIERLPDDQLTWANVTRKLFHEETRLARLEQRMEALTVSACSTKNMHLQLNVDSSQFVIPKMIWFVLIVQSGGTL